MAATLDSPPTQVRQTYAPREAADSKKAKNPNLIGLRPLYQIAIHIDQARFWQCLGANFLSV